MTSLDETPIKLFRRSLSKPLYIGRFHSPKCQSHSKDELISSPMLGNVPQNDDELEKRQRRRDKIEQLQRDNVGSPLTPAERRKSLGAGISGITNAQLAEHYANCMKLSAENKINAKNAFGLHLIDYMAEFLRNRDGQTNFQIASCTLDASAKIYASRVDCVYASTFKIASGLNIAKESEKNDEQCSSGDDNGKGNENKIEKKRKKSKKSNTIEQNPNSLNYKKLDVGLQIDPLFIKMSGEFDTAGLNGFLFNTVIAHDGCELIINSKTVPSSYIATEENSRVEIPKLKEVLRSLQESDVEVCPHLPDYSHLYSNAPMEEMSELQNDSLLPPHKRCRSFLESVSAANNLQDDCNDHGDNEDDEIFNDNMDDGGEVMDCFSNETIGNSNEDVLKRDLRENTLTKARLENITDMASVLADEPSEYSYFNHNLLCAWAGPKHWKLMQTNIANKKTTAVDKEDKNKRKTAKVFRYDYIGEKDIESHFIQNPKSIMLTKKTMDNWNSEKTTLPEDLHYDVKKLSHLFIKSLKIKRTTNPLEVNDQNNDYNYNNPNDCENFCPNIQNESSDVESDMTGFPVDDYTMTAPVGGLHKPCLSPVAENDETGGLGDLVAQPYKVPKIDIQYARTAKRIDVKQLKMKMWQVLTKCDEGNKENVQNEAMLPQMENKYSFSNLYSLLPKFISSSMASSLSVPITFVALLHLVNEKKLALEGLSDLSDFVISQG